MTLICQEVQYDCRPAEG